MTDTTLPLADVESLRIEGFRRLAAQFLAGADPLNIIGEPGHYQAGTDTNHFMGLCAECDSHYLAGMNLGEVEDRYRTGYVSQVKFEAYMHLWAVSAHHYSSTGAGWHKPPTDPAVQMFLALLEKARAGHPTTWTVIERPEATHG